MSVGSDPQLSSLPFQKRKHKMNQSNPSPTNKEVPTSTPSPATNVPTVLTTEKMVLVGSPNSHTPVNTTTVPPSPASLPNPATPFVPVTPQAPMTKPADSGAPNVVVQPMPIQQVQQNVIETTQTLIHALTSLQPQDKFKAKEYLQRHPDYLPRVINTLKHQQREQEAHQIQQELMGVPRGPIYQNPMQPRPILGMPRVIGMDYSNRPMYPQHPMMGGGGVPLRQPQPYPPPPPQA